ncbi:MAG: hypothetical protein ISS23_00035 [Nanoarchaeota archaeon]|nr:hypothetical protein [Nanoarchaeota archaeon]
MEKQDELEKRLTSLIEERCDTYFFNPRNASKIDLNKAGKIMQEEIFNSAEEDKAGILVFDGLTNVIFRTDLGTICMGKDTLNILSSEKNFRGIFIYSPQDGWGSSHQNSIYIEGKNKYIKEIKPKFDGISLSIKDEVEQKDTALELYVNKKTDIFYIPHLRK